VVASICLRILAVANENVFLRTLEYLRVVLVKDEDESAATYFSQMGNVGSAAMVSLERSDVIE